MPIHERQDPMAIIAISRGSFSRGREVAEKVAELLGYRCISREVLLEASELFNISELKLRRAIHDAPSLLGRLGRDQKKYVAFIHTALLREVQWGNVVYHGFAGHFFLQGISCALKIRIFADLEARVREEMKREGVTAEKAESTLRKDDEERRKWGLSLYGMDTSDPALYDMLLHLGTLTVVDAAHLIAAAAARPSFQTTPDCKKRLADRVLAAQVESVLIDEFPLIRVTAENGEAAVHVTTGLSIHTLLQEKRKIVARVEALATELGGAEKVIVTFDHPI
jgi:cytidylate kinase